MKVRKMVRKGVTAKDQHIREYRVFGNNSSQPPIVEETFDPSKEMDKTWKQVEKRAAMIQKFKSMEPYLPKSEVLEYKKQLGLIKEDEDGNEKDATDDTNMPLMLEVIKSEKDPQIRQQLVMALMNKKGGADSNMMMLAMAMGNMNNQPKDDFKEKILEEILRDRLTGRKEEGSSLRDALETIKAAQEMFGGGGGDPLDDLIEKKKKMEELGLVSKGGNSIEEKRMDLDWKKFEYQQKRESEKDIEDAEFKKKAVSEGIKAIPKVLQLLSKKEGVVIDEPEEEEEPQKEPVQVEKTISPEQPPIDVIEKVCNNPDCKRKFTITHIDNPRFLICPNLPDRKCDRMYELTKDGKLAEYQLSGEDLEKAVIDNGGEPLENEDEGHNDK